MDQAEGLTGNDTKHRVLPNNYIITCATIGSQGQFNKSFISHESGAVGLDLTDIT